MSACTRRWSRPWCRRPCLGRVQTYRSWWGARVGVVGVLEDGRNLRLRLNGGLEAPVSRARIGGLREEGWL